jgi:hypothetical protein
MSVTRVQYRERQRLTAADLRAEQDYRLRLGGRHHLAHHDWGVVRGLRVVGNPNGKFTLTRGVAIDGYGRELVVGEPQDFEIGDPEQCRYVSIYYCEDPEQVPPDRRCADDPAPRIRHRVALVVSEEHIPAPVTPIDPFAARAAGSASPARPWPVLVATVGLECHPEDPDAPLVTYDRVRYVRHRASVIQSPNARARLQLGLRALTDVYHFLLSVGAGGTLEQRIGIDRDGVTHVWRPLVVAGGQVTGQIAIAENKFLQITAPKPGGIGARLRVAGQIDRVKNTVSASLLHLADPLASQRPVIEAVAGFKANSPVSQLPLVADHTPLAILSVLDNNAVPTILPKRARQTRRTAAQRDEPAVLTFSGELKPAGGQLVLRSLPRADEEAAIACGDIERARADAGEGGTPVVQFRPAEGIKGDGLARELHAATVSKATDPVPRTEMRISGGEEDETDTSSRFAVGTWQAPGIAPPAWVPGFRMDGGRRVEILVPTGNSTTDALLEVDDTVYLPPIGKKDPLLPDLMAMAFIAGMRQMGRVTEPNHPTLSLDIDDVAPNPIVRGESLSYILQVTWGDVSEVNRCLEIVTGIEGNGDMAFRTITGVTVDSNSFTVTIENFTHRASRVRLEIQMLVTVDDIKRVASVSVDVTVAP